MFESLGIRSLFAILLLILIPLFLLRLGWLLIGELTEQRRRVSSK